MYIQHKHMLCGEFHICDENVNDNVYSTTFLHEALDVNHKMVMLGIGWYHDKFSHIFVQHQYYPKNYTLCLSIL